MNPAIQALLIARMDKMQTTSVLGDVSRERLLMMVDQAADLLIAAGNAAPEIIHELSRDVAICQCNRTLGRCTEDCAGCKERV